MFNQLVTNRDKSPEPLLGTLEHHQTPKAPDSQRCPRGLHISLSPRSLPCLSLLTSPTLKIPWMSLLTSLTKACRRGATRESRSSRDPDHGRWRHRLVVAA
jgi:hypothetical protein